MGLILWAAAGLVALLMNRPAGVGGHEVSQGCTASLSLAFGVWAFWRSGAAQITAAGLYCLAASIFVGFAGLSWVVQGGAVSSDVYVGTITGYWTTLTLYALFWSRRLSFLAPAAAPAQVTQWAMTMGLIGSATALGLGTVGIGSLSQFTMGGMALFMVGAMMHRRTGGRLGLRPVIAVAVLVAYWQVAFSGFGRLNLVSLALIAAVIGSAIAGHRGVKAVVILGLPPAILVFVRLREQFGVSSLGSGRDGLGSVVNPLRDFGRLVRLHGQNGFDLAHGDTFVATALFWVPRSLWPGKPDGFGRELTAVLEPELLVVNHSMAAHSYGEWYYNFAWWGVIAMIPAVGLLVYFLDVSLARALAFRLDSRRDFLLLVCSLILVANVANLMWVGSFTYVARAGQQLLLVLAIGAAFASRSTVGQPRSDQKVTAAPAACGGEGISTRSSR